MLEAAINGQADALVTHNTRDFQDATPRFGVRLMRPAELLQELKIMKQATYPLKLPNSIKAAAARLAKEDGVSLNQWIATAVAQKVGAVETGRRVLQAPGQRPHGRGPWPHPRQGA